MSSYFFFNYSMYVQLKIRFYFGDVIEYIKEDSKIPLMNFY